MTENPLGYEKISKLLKNFAVPSIVASLIGSIYNIVDQIFIGQGVGYLGNAATNVAYPFSTICLAIALLVGIGSALSSEIRSLLLLTKLPSPGLIFTKPINDSARSASRIRPRLTSNISANARSVGSFSPGFN